MNIPKIFLLAVSLLAFGVGAIGQESPKPVLIDEYTVTPCDDFLGRLDVFLSELRRYPDSKGLILIRNLPTMRHRTVISQSMMESHFEFRGFDRSRIEIVRADGSEPNREFWRIPPGSSGPRIEQAIYGYKTTETVREPFVLTEETKFGTQICPEIDDARIFAEFLKANPSARGNIIVRDNSRVNARKKAARILRKFEVVYGISRNRLRTFLAKLQRPSNHDEPIVEYWYLP